MTVRELLEQAFCVEDCAMIKYIYDWYDVVPCVLEPLSNLRNRVAINDVKAYLDEKKNPVPAATGSGR